MKNFLATLIFCAATVQAVAAAFDIGEDMEDELFWKADPVLFVKNHSASGFEFLSDQREGADSRLEGGVTYYGLPVYESKITFGEAGGIAHVELMLFANAGTEALEAVTASDGKKFFKRVRIDKAITRTEFGDILKTVRKRLTAPSAKAPQAVSERRQGQAAFQFSQQWPMTDIPSRTRLTWNYTQEGKKTETFKAGFVRVMVDGPDRLATQKSSKGAKATKMAKGSKKIVDNIMKDARGNVYIDNIPMVDQGQKGYCAVASAERVLRYFGLEVDEHEIGEAAGTSADRGTTTRGMKDSIEAIGRKYKLATVVAYGDFDKDSSARIAGLTDEVRAYNKMAKKFKKPEIEDSVYIRHEGNVTYFDPSAVDRAMDPEVRKEMKVNGMQKSKFTKFMADIHQQVNKGIPLFWSLTLGIYPEPGLMQVNGGHMRLIIGYNDKKKEILYSDSWGAGHELKHMPADWAFAVSDSLLYMKPLTK